MGWNSNVCVCSQVLSYAVLASVRQSYCEQTAPSTPLSQAFVTFVQCLLGGWINTHKNVSNERKQLKPFTSKQMHTTNISLQDTLFPFVSCNRVEAHSFWSILSFFCSYPGSFTWKAVLRHTQSSLWGSRVLFLCQWWACAFKPSFLRTSFIMYIKSQETVKTSPLSHKADMRERPFHLLKPVPSCKPSSVLSSTSLPCLNGSFNGSYPMGVGARPITEHVSQLALHLHST